MKLHVLICCYNDSLLDVPDILLPERPDVSYVISHQHSAGYSLPDDADELKSRLNEMLARPDVVLTSIEGKGVSRNRNNCLMKCFETAADDDVCLIADDDVRYFKDSFDRVLSAFASNPSAGFIQFRIKTLGSSRQFRRLPYPVNPYRIRKSMPHALTRELLSPADSLQAARLWVWFQPCSNTPDANGSLADGIPLLQVARALPK